MRRLPTMAIALLHTVVLSSGFGQDAGNQPRPFVQIQAQEPPPTVRAIAPIDDSNVFFLDKRGRIGVAKFSPGLSLIGWQPYSDVRLDALPELAVGPGYSVITASSSELTQAFDTDQDGEVDFFQALLREWPGSGQGVAITAGPVADPFGRILFALSPFLEKSETADTAEEEPTEAPPPPTPKARLVAWHPESASLVTVTESQLPIHDFAVDSRGLLAARLSMPNYKDGYYISLTQLPPFDPATPQAAPDPIPFTLPSLLIPAELTQGNPPTQLAFLHEEGREKLLAVCPASRQLIEVVPTLSDGVWQGSILLRSVFDGAIETVSEITPGQLLGGGDEGFLPIDLESGAFRIQSVDVEADGIVLAFTHPVDRQEAVRPDSYSVRAVSLRGGDAPLTVHPVIESDGRSVILKSEQLQAGTVLRVVCTRVPSETGETLLSSAVFYTIHRR